MWNSRLVMKQEHLRRRCRERGFVNYCLDPPGSRYTARRRSFVVEIDSLDLRARRAISDLHREIETKNVVQGTRAGVFDKKADGLAALIWLQANTSEVDIEDRAHRRDDRLPGCWQLGQG